MADSKISSLSAITSLATTDELVVASAGATDKIAAKYLPGYQLDYAQVTSNTSITATTPSTANTIVTGNAVTYDGSTQVLIEFFSFQVQTGNNATVGINLWDGSTELGIAAVCSDSAGGTTWPVHLFRVLTPSAASHTYSWRAYRATADGIVSAGTGAAGAGMPAFIRITKI